MLRRVLRWLRIRKIYHMNGPRDWYDEFQKKNAINANEAMSRRGNEPLTEDQKFSLAVIAGVKFESKFEDGKLKMTTEPCSVVWDGQGYVVYTTRQ